MLKLSKHVDKILYIIFLSMPNFLFAADIVVIDTGNTAWMLIATGLVLMMLIPGLALFYGGLVKRENVISVLMQSFGTCCFVSVIWALIGSSLVFSEGNMFIGSLKQSFLNHLTLNNTNSTIPESIFVAFQMTFAIITPALMLGAVADRIKFSSSMLFVCLWSIFVYCPIAHWIWGPKGLLDGTGIENYKGIFNLGPVIDFAGGMVVHVSSGVAGLIACIVMGPKKNYGTESPKIYNLSYSIIGACSLWVGWFGFNAGSALAANSNASMALLVTHLSTATSAATWMMIEWKVKGKISSLGAITGMLAGLVAITPASGYVGVSSPMLIGFFAATACFWGINCLKAKFKYDDSLDAFGVHGIGGITGSILAGIFAEKSIGGISGFIEGNSDLLFAQITGVLITIIYSAIMTFIILKFINSIIGLRVKEEVEVSSLDLEIHGEKLTQY